MPKKSLVKQRELAGHPHDWPSYVPETLQRIYAARGILDPAGADRRLARLHSPAQLGSIQLAAQLIGQAVIDQKHIVIAGDYDCDGATGTAVAVRGLRMLGAKHVDFVVPNRFKHGYGLSVELVDTIDPIPDMIITVDSGVSSIEGVAHAKAKGITVVVTDHHLPGDILPDADVIVNPNLKDDPFPSKSLAGVGVMMYTLIATQRYINDTIDFLPNMAVDLKQLLDLVAVGTVADLVPLDQNNRILVDSGINRIRAGHACVGLKALIRAARREESTLSATDIGFSVAPRLNAAGRLEDMRLGILTLISDDPEEVDGYVKQLEAINSERRTIQADMVAEAETKITALGPQDHYGVVVFDPSWHSGIVGLVASKLKESLYRPTVALAPSEEGSDDIRGSARSIPGFHLRDALVLLDSRYPNVMKKFGGHAMAAGLSLSREKVELFQRAFDEVARDLLSDEMMEAVIYTDGQLNVGDISLDFARLLKSHGPWGQGFPEPVFENFFYVQEYEATRDGKHLRLNLVDIRDQSFHKAMYFNGMDPNWEPKGYVKVAFELGVNAWNGNETVQMLVRQMGPATQGITHD